MKLIVGLGNKGTDYDGTRHNAGFLVVDALLKEIDAKAKFSLEKKFEAEVARVGGAVLAKPQTFMNNSGRSVRKIMDFYKLSIDDLIVVHDDLDIKLGDFKIQTSTGPKVHNGLNSVEQVLGSKEFLRVRVGVDSRHVTRFEGSGADYVLGKFSKEDSKIFLEVVLKIVGSLKDKAK